MPKTKKQKVERRLTVLRSHLDDDTLLAALSLVKDLDSLKVEVSKSALGLTLNGTVFGTATVLRKLWREKNGAPLSLSEQDGLNRDPIKFVLDSATPSDEVKKMVASIGERIMRESHVSIRDLINKLFTDSLSNVEASFGGALNGSPFKICCKKASNAALKDDTLDAFDYQIEASVSFQIFARNRDKFKSPMDVAHALAKNLPPNDLVVEVAKKQPFINIKLTKSLMIDSVQSILKLGIPKPCVPKKKIAIDYSSPNVAKDMHVGHLRSSVIGDSISRVLEFCGHEVIRLNHVGDWGTQFGMLIAYLKRKHPDFCENPPNITDLTQLYKAAKLLFNEDEKFKHDSHVEVVKLQAGDAENTKIWKKLCDLSKQMFEVVYKRLGIHPGLKVQGESFYNPLIPATLQDLASKKMIKEENGAKLVWVKSNKKKKAKKKKKSKQDESDGGKTQKKQGGPPEGMMDVPLIAQKSDGGYGYDSTDLCAVQYRLQTMKCDSVFYCVDAGQSLHFDLIFGAARQAGWAGTQHRLEHVKFGVVTGEDGTRIKTRSGKSTRLIDLLDEAVSRAKEELLKRIQDPKSTCKLKMHEVDDVASKLAHGCVKYFDLRLNRINNYAFSFDKLLDPRGDTNVYIQQQHSRINSIFEKAKEKFNVNVEDLLKKDLKINLDTPQERAVAATILELPDVLERVTVDLLPSGICSWIASMCKALSSMYAAVFVLSNDDKMPGRLLLLQACAVSMRKAMELIGLDPLYAM